MMQVAHAVGRAGGVHQPAPPDRLVVADAPAAAGGGARIGSHARGEVVRLGRQAWDAAAPESARSARGAERLGGRQHALPRVPWMAELSSQKAMTELGPEAASGCLTMSMRCFSGTRSPSTHSSPLNTQWRECSELACAIWNSSTSVGSRSEAPEDVRDELQVARVPTAAVLPVELLQGRRRPFAGTGSPGPARATRPESKEAKGSR